MSVENPNLNPSPDPTKPTLRELEEIYNSNRIFYNDLLKSGPVHASVERDEKTGAIKIFKMFRTDGILVHYEDMGEIKDMISELNKGKKYAPHGII